MIPIGGMLVMGQTQRGQAGYCRCTRIGLVMAMPTRTNGRGAESKLGCTGDRVNPGSLSGLRTG
jgi:hypothetical protein